MRKYLLKNLFTKVDRHSNHCFGRTLFGCFAVLLAFLPGRIILAGYGDKKRNIEQQKKKRTNHSLVAIFKAIELLLYCQRCELIRWVGGNNDGKHEGCDVIEQEGTGKLVIHLFSKKWANNHNLFAPKSERPSRNSASLVL